MRFAAASGSNVNDYAAAGKAVANSAAKTFAVQRKTGPDYGKLSQVAMKTATEEKISSMKASSQVTRAGINAYQGAVEQGNKIEVFNKKVDINAKQKMAGGIAAIGKYAAVGYLSKDNDKGREYPTNTSAKSDLIKASRATIKGIDAEQDARDDGNSVKPSSGGSSKPGKVTNADGTLVSSAQAVSAGKGTGGKGNVYNMQQMTDIAVQGGFSPENARTMAAISMGESGGNAGIDTVQSGLDPSKSNEFSVGLSQINVQAHGDKLKRRGWTEADLRDPVKNMTIAKEVYDEVGSFKPWSVFQKGLHNQYLN